MLQCDKQKACPFHALQLTLRKEEHAIWSHMLRQRYATGSSRPQTPNDSQYGRLATARGARDQAALPAVNLDDKA
jgi:hypothetical protein